MKVGVLGGKKYRLLKLRVSRELQVSKSLKMCMLTGLGGDH